MQGRLSQAVLVPATLLATRPSLGFAYGRTLSVWLKHSVTRAVTLLAMAPSVAFYTQERMHTHVKMHCSLEKQHNRSPSGMSVHTLRTLRVASTTSCWLRPSRPADLTFHAALGSRRGETGWGPQLQIMYKSCPLCNSLTCFPILLRRLHDVGLEMGREEAELHA